MAPAQLWEMLQQLGSSNPQPSWENFLREYASIILAVARRLERDADHASACFVYTCEQLAARQFARLRRFDSGGPASFETWLCVVARNLCADWRRKKFGRERTFEAITRLPEREQELFRLRYEQGISAEHAWDALQTRYPELTRDQYALLEERVGAVLTARHADLLEARRPRHHVVAAPDGQAYIDLVPDSGPGPEILALENDQRERLLCAITRLPATDRLALKLRFVKGLTLEQAAKLMDLKGAQAADRRIEAALDRLRRELK